MVQVICREVHSHHRLATAANVLFQLGNVKSMGLNSLKVNTVLLAECSHALSIWKTQHILTKLTACVYCKVNDIELYLLFI